MHKSASFSPDRKYRYVLHRRWESLFPTKRVTFIGLNPSKADENIDDNTISVCIGFAKAWGYNEIAMVNLFAFRSTKPEGMMKEPDPIGQDNDIILQSVCMTSDLVIAAWGTNGEHMDRDEQVLDLLNLDIYCLAETKNGHPHHPLYLSKDTKPFLWSQRECIV